MGKRPLFPAAVLVASLPLAAAAATVSFPAPTNAIVVRGGHGVPLVLAVDPGASVTGQPNHYLPRRGVVAGNFSDEPNATYLSWNGYSVCNADVCGLTTRIAAGFTPKAATRVSGIEVGLMPASISTDYSHVANVALYTDSGGVPGKEIDGQNVTAAAATPNACCLTTHVKLKSNPKLKAGTQYWVVVTPAANAYLVWAFENSDFVTPEPFATDGGSGWSSANGPWEVPSFQVE